MIARRRKAIRPTLVPLIDVLFILLIYFMVTSVYRDLDMIPVARGADAPGAAPPAAEGGTFLVRVAADGRALARGRALDDAVLAEARAQGLRVVLLPSPEAPLAALVAAMDRLTEAGLTDVELVRLAPRE